MTPLAAPLLTVDITAGPDLPAGATRCVGVAAGQQPDGVSSAWLAATGFTGRAGQISIAVDERSQPGAPMVLVGLGAGLTRPQTLAAAGDLVRQAARLPHLALEVATFAGVDMEAFTQGAQLASYRFDRYLTRATPPALSRITLVGEVDTEILEPTAILADAVCIARDMVNEPGSSLTAPVAAERAVEVAAGSGLAVEISGLDEIRELGLGGLLGVNRGSDQPPRLVHLRHEPPHPVMTVALVGKGVCFDTGGNNVKKTSDMTRMKKDMAGGAAVIGAMSAIGRLGLPARVLAWVPFTDNMNGGDAMRPGDILTIRNGRTIEVLDTDNEGRLILADALCLASEATPDVLIDVATLTGTVGIAVGRSYAGVMGTDEALINTVRAAGDHVGELVWPFPLSDEAASALQTPFADMKNNSPLQAFTSSAGCLLREFVTPGIPWAHIDMASPSLLEAPRAEHPAGGTGWGVRLIVETLTRLIAAR